MCSEGLARLCRRVWRGFVCGSREISLVPSLHRASTDALILMFYITPNRPLRMKLRSCACTTWSISQFQGQPKHHRKINHFRTTKHALRIYIAFATSYPIPESVPVKLYTNVYIHFGSYLRALLCHKVCLKQLTLS